MRVLISVIVPAYNAEKTLGNTIESILAQNYTNFELIIVDDGSKDRTAAICDDYTSRDPRVKVIHKANGGVGAARNSGLEVAQGEFIAFVDSDDTVKVQYLSNLIDGISDGIDLVMSHETVNRDGFWLVRRYNPMAVKGDSFDEILVGNDIHTCPWAKLYRMRIITENNVLFPVDMPIGEDLVFLFTYMSHCNGVNVTDCSDYLYDNSGIGTLTHKLYALDKERAILRNVQNALINFSKQKRICSVSGKKRIERIESIYKERVVDALYFSSNLKSDERKKVLKEIGTQNMRVFSYSTGFRSFILSHLLHYQMLNSYDLLRSFAMKMRKK